MAEKKEEYAMLRRGLAEFPLEAVVQAVRVLDGDHVPSSEKALGVAAWLKGLHEKLAQVKSSKLHLQLSSKSSKSKDNICWLAVAQAPAGWCHVRSTIVGTLLEDIVAGLPFETIKARWAQKVHPLQYQRPTTIKDGAVEQAEKIVAQLGSHGSLARRFAKLEEVVAIWKPDAILQAVNHLHETMKKADEGNIFGHLKAKQRPSVKPVDLPPETMTWAMFHSYVMNGIPGPGYASGETKTLSIEMLVPNQRLPFIALVTAINPDAPPILQWDTEPRNPVSWYLYHQGSLPQAWNVDLLDLSYGGSIIYSTFSKWVKVNAICNKPPFWYGQDKYEHQGRGVIFILDGCRDLRLRDKTGGGFFPSMLRNEYHGVRQVMEAYAQSAEIAGKEEATACGLLLQSDAKDANYVLRVTTKTDQRTYKIDRWQ
jgi:hypothetical protein